MDNWCIAHFKKSSKADSSAPPPSRKTETCVQSSWFRGPSFALALDAVVLKRPATAAAVAHRAVSRQAIAARFSAGFGNDDELPVSRRLLNISSRSSPDDDTSITGLRSLRFCKRSSDAK